MNRDPNVLLVQVVFTLLSHRHLAFDLTSPPPPPTRFPSHILMESQACPRNETYLRQELHWHLGRLALARLQQRTACSDIPFFSLQGSVDQNSNRAVLQDLAREAGDHLHRAVELATVGDQTVANGEVTPNLNTSKGRRQGKTIAKATAHGTVSAVMAAREALARVELAKLCLTGVGQDNVSIAFFATAGSLDWSRVRLLGPRELPSQVFFVQRFVYFYLAVRECCTTKHIMEGLLTLRVKDRASTATVRVSPYTR